MVTFNETQARIFQYLRRHPLSTTSTMVDHAVGLSGWEIDMGLQRLRHAGLIESGPKILARGGLLSGLVEYLPSASSSRLKERTRAKSCAGRQF